MRTRFGYVMEEDIGVDEALHSRPEYAAACPYCHPPATLEAQKVATAAKFEAYPGDTLTVEQRMSLLDGQYNAQVQKLAQLHGVSRSGLLRALGGWRR